MESVTLRNANASILRCNDDRIFGLSSTQMELQTQIFRVPVGDVDINTRPDGKLAEDTVEHPSDRTSFSLGSLTVNLDVRMRMAFGFNRMSMVRAIEISHDADRTYIRECSNDGPKVIVMKTQGVTMTFNNY